MTLHLIAQEVDNIAIDLHQTPTLDLFEAKIRLIQLQNSLPGGDADVTGSVRTRISRVLAAVDQRLCATSVLPTQGRRQLPTAIATLFPSQRISSDQVVRQDADINRLRKVAAIDHLMAAPGPSTSTIA